MIIVIITREWVGYNTSSTLLLMLETTRHGTARHETTRALAAANARVTGSSVVDQQERSADSNRPLVPLAVFVVAAGA